MNFSRFPLFISLCLLLLQSHYVHAGWLDKFFGNKSSAEDVQPRSMLSNADLSRAFKQALDLGSQAVVQQVSQVDGFNGDSAIHIPLPAQLQTARSWLDTIGMAQSLDKLEVTLNRAAETAAPQARDLFVGAIAQMSFDDVRQIYQGSDDAATRYFQEKTSAALSSAMRPLISHSLSEVGALQQYDEIISAYKNIPFVPDLKADLTEHVVAGSLKGIFHYLAQQEAAIRKDPLKHTSALLKKVFGV